MSPWDMRLCFWAGKARRAGGGGAAAAPQLARRQGRRAGGRSPTRRRPHAQGERILPATARRSPGLARHPHGEREGAGRTR